MTGYLLLGNDGVVGEIDLGVEAVRQHPLHHYSGGALSDFFARVKVMQPILRSSLLENSVGRLPVWLV
jgi:hypothetical protein